MLNYKVSYVFYDDFSQEEKFNTLAAFRNKGDACLYAQSIYDTVKHYDIYYKLIVHDKRKTFLAYNIERS